MFIFYLIHNYYMKEYINHLKDECLSYNTTQAYTMNINLFFCHYDKLNKENIVSFLQENKEPSTLALRKASLFRYLTYINSDLIEWCKKVKLPSNVPILRDVLTKKEVYKISENSFGRNLKYKLRNKYIILFLYYSGVRVTELISIKGKDINNLTISIKGKGLRIRKVFITKELSQWRNVFGGEYLFSDSQGRKLTSKQINLIIGEMTRRSSITKYVTPHTLRRSFCTNLIKSGANIKMVSTLMGHRKIETTARYMHFTEKDILREYRRHI